MSRRILLFLLCGLLLGVVGVALTQPMPLPSVPLFAPASDAQLRSVAIPPEQVGTRRTRLAQLDPLAATQLRGGALTLNLFDDASFTAVGGVRSDTATRGRSTMLWTGAAVGEQNSNVILLTDAEGNIDLRVLTLGHVYYAQSLGGGLVRISDIDPSAGRYDSAGQPINDIVLTTPTEDEQQQVARNQISPRADDGSVIDLMVVYTPAAVALLGSDAATRLAIEGAVALANVTYENSDVNFRLRLVHVAQVNYVELGNDLNRLSGTNDGYMDEIHQWRNDYAADLVALIAGTSVANRSYCGIANLPFVLPSPASAFSVTEALCISDITLVHELGHNMGKAHDHANGFGAIHPYAYGYQDPSTGVGDYGDWVTLMAYSNGGQCPASYIPGVCPAIAYWSDKDATYMGKPLGNTEDNARSLNETAYQIANYRVSADGGATVPTPFPTLTPIPTPSVPTPEVVLNGSFELDNDLNGLPDGWAWKGTAGKRSCNGDAAHGSCAVVLKSGAKIQQNVPFDLGSLGAGDALGLSLMMKAKPNNACGSAKLQVKYLAGGKDMLKLTLPTGTPNQWNPVTGTLTLANAPKVVKIIIAAGAACPKALRVDDVHAFVVE